MQMLDWSVTFRPLLGPAMGAIYKWPGQAPALTASMRKVLGSSAAKYEGDKRTNCTWLTAYLLGTAFDVDFTLDDAWARWQITRGEDHDYQGYAPGVMAEQGFGELLPAGSVPDGVCLVQTMGVWPHGHSRLVLDRCPRTDKVLTLESNSGYGLNGLGFAGLGNIRSVNAADWRNRPVPKWADIVKGQREVIVTRLNIDQGSVRDWVDGMAA